MSLRTTGESSRPVVPRAGAASVREIRSRPFRPNVQVPSPPYVRRSGPLAGVAAPAA